MFRTCVAKWFGDVRKKAAIDWKATCMACRRKYHRVCMHNIVISNYVECTVKYYVCCWSDALQQSSKIRKHSFSFACINNLFSRLTLSKKLKLFSPSSGMVHPTISVINERPMTKLCNVFQFNENDICVTSTIRIDNNGSFSVVTEPWLSQYEWLVELSEVKFRVYFSKSPFTIVCNVFFHYRTEIGWNSKAKNNSIFFRFNLIQISIFSYNSCTVHIK